VEIQEASATFELKLFKNSSPGDRHSRFFPGVLYNFVVIILIASEFLSGLFLIEAFVSGYKRKMGITGYVYRYCINMSSSVNKTSLQLPFVYEIVSIRTENAYE